MNQPLLEIRGLSVRYDRIEVVHDLDLHVDEGEAVGLLGANGAGKTTTMYAVMGQRSVRGEIRLGDDRLDNLARHAVAHRGVSLVPEGRRAFPNLTTADNLRMGAYPASRTDRHSERKRLDEVLDLFPDLRDHMHRRAGVLSGGQQQMLAIARALMAKPSVLLLDEPSLGLAPKIVEQVYHALTRLKKSGTSLLLAEQNARLALALVDRAYVMETGRVVEEGSAEELRASSRVEDIYLGGSA